LNAGSTVFHEHPSETAYLISHLDVGSLRGALVQGQLKYLYTGPTNDADPDERLYDVVADPSETRNLWAEHPAEARAMRARYFGWLHTWSERWGTVEARHSAGDRKALREILFPDGTKRR
jgi:hypothetical protein